MVVAVASSCPQLNTEGMGYVTDGEKALYSALGEVMKSATGLCCLSHFQQNCKAKLKKLGTTKPQERDSVWEKGRRDFGCRRRRRSTTQTWLVSCKDALEKEERIILGKDNTYKPLFWAYLKSHENMMKECMVADARRKAGMPQDQEGLPLRSYTNQSEIKIIINNVLTKQK